MKKILATFVISAMLAIMLPLSADAQRCRTRKSYNRTKYSRNYNRRTYQTRGYVYKRPNFYQRHRNLINIGIGSGAGAIIGGLLGGRRGALAGALLGGGGGAVYSYGIKPKKKRYYRRY